MQWTAVALPRLLSGRSVMPTRPVTLILATVILSALLLSMAVGVLFLQLLPLPVAPLRQHGVTTQLLLVAARSVVVPHRLLSGRSVMLGHVLMGYVLLTLLRAMPISVVVQLT